MANLNKVFLMGNLTRDPELRYLSSGAAVANLRLAINRRYRTQSGEMKEEVCFVTVVVWGKQAESCSQYLSKGRGIFIEGRLQTRSWEGENGQKRSIMEVRADRVQFLGKPLSADEISAPADNINPEQEAIKADNGESETKNISEEAPF